MTACLELEQMNAWLGLLRSGEMGASQFSSCARSQSILLSALPPRYAEVLHGLLDRLEAGALFTEESCSFSVKDLHDSLSLWMTKAQAQLSKG